MSLNHRHTNSPVQMESGRSVDGILTVKVNYHPNSITIVKCLFLKNMHHNFLNFRRSFQIAYLGARHRDGAYLSGFIVLLIIHGLQEENLSNILIMLGWVISQD